MVDEKSILVSFVCLIQYGEKGICFLEDKVEHVAHNLGHVLYESRKMDGLQKRAFNMGPLFFCCFV